MKNIKTYSVTHLAGELGVTRQAIYYWIKKGWVVPMRDYRNYPVFTDRDLLSIKKWKNKITRTKPVVNNAASAAFHQDPLPKIPPVTWEEIQKLLYR